MFNCVYFCVMKWTLQFSWRWVKLSIASTVTFPFGTCGEHTTLSFLNCSHEFLVNKDSSCNTRSYEMVISSCSDFLSLFSLVVAWMFGPIYTGSGASLFGEGRKLVQMPEIVSLFFFPLGTVSRDNAFCRLRMRYYSMNIWAI